MATKPHPIKKTVAVIGLGYVGLPVALLAQKKGYRVIGIDTDETKIKKINHGNNRITATTDVSQIAKADIIIICVPTPINKQRIPDYSAIEAATLSIARHLKKHSLIILESTVNPGVCEELIIPLIRKHSQQIAGKDYLLAHCPERINPGDKKWTVKNIPRVIGGFDAKSLRQATSFYRHLLEAAITPMNSLKEAEACKIVENSFRNVNIAFVNELAMSFSQLGIDVVNVIKGASTKPFAFMPHYPGCGIGGHCIPVDPYYLIDYAKQKNGFTHQFLALACKTNDQMPVFTVKLAADALKSLGKSLRGERVTVLGLAYKAGIDDIRESPGMNIIKELKKRGALVQTYDPYVKQLSTKLNLKDALQGSKVVILATDHKEFLSIDPKKMKELGLEIVIDGRNCLDKNKYQQAGLIYKGIGT